MELGAGGRTIARGHESGSLNIPPPREQERKLEQEKLSGVVKSVHRRLRKKYREGKQGAGWGGGEASSPQPLVSSPLRPRSHHYNPKELHVSHCQCSYPRPGPFMIEPQSASGGLLPPHFLRRPFRRVPGLWRNLSPQPLQSPAAVLRLLSPHTKTYPYRGGGDFWLRETAGKIHLRKAD